MSKDKNGFLYTLNKKQVKKILKEKSVEPIKIGDIVSFLNFSGNGEIVGLSSIEKADDYYCKNFGISIFETFDPPTKNTQFIQLNLSVKVNSLFLRMKS